MRWLGQEAMKNKIKYNSVLKDINNKFKNKNFEFVLSNLTLEDLIRAKLELSCRGLNEKLYGFPIYHNTKHIVRESLVRFALDFCNSQVKAATLLGINIVDLKAYIKRHKLNISKENEENE